MLIPLTGGGSKGTTLPGYLKPSGDTSGAADTTAINNSLTNNALTILAPGQWYVTNVGFTVNNRALMGSGPGTVVNVIAGSPGLVFSGPGGIEVCDLSIVVGAGSWGLTVNGLYDAHIHDLWMTGPTAAGGITINGDDALEQHYTDIVMRTMGGIGFDYERTTSIYTGSLYLDRVRLVTPPAGAQGFKFHSTAGSASLNTCFMTQCVADAYYADACLMSNVAQVFVTECWFACIAAAAAGSAPLHIVGGFEHTYEGCITFNGITTGPSVKVEGAISLIYLGGGHIFDGAGTNTALSTSGVTSGQLTMGEYISACGTFTDNQAAFAARASYGGLSVSAPAPDIDAVASTTAQFSGPALRAYNTTPGLGNQGGFAWQHGVLNAGATEGFITLAQLDHTGAFVKNIFDIDLNAGTIQTLLPLVPQAGVSVFLCPPTSYGPASRTTLSVTGATMAALSSANVNTGNFTAPPSGSVVVTASLVAQSNAANSNLAFGLAAHGTVSPIIGQLVIDNDNGTSIPRLRTMQFVVTGLVAGNTYNLDLLAATAAGDVISAFAQGQSTTTPTLGAGADAAAPITMTVQAV